MRAANSTAQFSDPLPALGMGCWPFAGGSAWGGVTDGQAMRAVATALECGVTFFDVAPAYGRGHAEELLGRALRSAGAAGRRALVATKCGVRFEGRHGRIDNSPAWIRHEIDRSLARLGTTTIDLYQVHWPDRSVPIEETLGELTRLREAGKIRAIGLCNHSARDTEVAIREAGIVTCQGLYNLLERNPTFYHGLTLDYRSEAEILPLCARNGVAFLPYSPLMQGLLTGRWESAPQFPPGEVRRSNPKLRSPRFEEFAAIVRQLQPVAEPAGHSLAGLAISWLAERPGVGPVIAASTRPEHIVANARAIERGIDSATRARIDSILEPYRALLDR